MRPAKPVLAVLLARRGWGKSTALRSILRRHPNAWVVDAAGDLSEDVPQSVRRIEPFAGEKGALVAAETIARASIGDYVVIDDADGFMRAQSRGHLHTSLTFARNLKVSVVIAAKQPSDIPPWLAGNADAILHTGFLGRSQRSWAAELGIEEIDAPPLHSFHVLWMVNREKTVRRAEAVGLELDRMPC